MQGEFQFLGELHLQEFNDQSAIVEIELLTKKEAPDTLKVLVLDNQPTSFDMVCIDTLPVRLLSLSLPSVTNFFFFRCVNLLPISPLEHDTDRPWRFGRFLQREGAGTYVQDYLFIFGTLTQRPRDCMRDRFRRVSPRANPAGSVSTGSKSLQWLSRRSAPRPTSAQAAKHTRKRSLITRGERVFIRASVSDYGAHLFPDLNHPSHNLVCYKLCTLCIYLSRLHSIITSTGIGKLFDS